MQWYVLQTRTGEEEKLVDLVHKLVPDYLYGTCFVVRQEQLWRRRQQNLIHVKHTFPGYVFITSKEPKALFFCLKKLPAMARMLAADEFAFLSLEKEEADFLKQILDEDYVIRLSYMDTDSKGKIFQIKGPLAECADQIVRIRFGKRYALVKFMIHGEEKNVLLGIVLKGDLHGVVFDENMGGKGRGIGKKDSKSSSSHVV